MKGFFRKHKKCAFVLLFSILFVWALVSTGICVWIAYVRPNFGAVILDNAQEENKNGDPMLFSYNGFNYSYFPPRDLQYQPTGNQTKKPLTQLLLKGFLYSSLFPCEIYGFDNDPERFFLLYECRWFGDYNLMYRSDLTIPELNPDNLSAITFVETQTQTLLYQSEDPEFIKAWYEKYTTGKLTSIQPITVFSDEAIVDENGGLIRGVTVYAVFKNLSLQCKLGDITKQEVPG